MKISSHLKAFRGYSFILCALFCLALAASQAVAAQADKPAAPADKPAATDKAASPDKDALPPLPAEVHAQQSIQMDGKALKYTVTVGALPVRDKDGKVAGNVVVTSYTVDGDNRPVTFAFNGGPGASSVYLNFGAIGPKHIDAGNEGDSPSDPTALKDNPGTWLDFTDLIFVDPIGTGFSRATVPEDQAKKLFYSSNARCRVPFARGLRLAGKEQSAGLAQVPGRRKLRRLSRAAHNVLPAVATGCGPERRSAGVALFESDHREQR